MPEHLLNYRLCWQQEWVQGSSYIELAVKLLQKRIEVRVIRRKFKHTIGEDLVVCQIGMPSYDFPPALKPPEELVVLAKDASKK